MMQDNKNIKSAMSRVLDDIAKSIDNIDVSSVHRFIGFNEIGVAADQIFFILKNNINSNFTTLISDLETIMNYYNDGGDGDLDMSVPLTVIEQIKRRCSDKQI